MGSAARILDFQNVLSWTSSRVICSVCISLRTPSIHLPLGLPLGLFPGTLMSPTALTSLFSSILCMCPYHRSLISLTFSCKLLTPSSFLMSTLFTLSLNVTPFILFNILISVFSGICSSILFISIIVLSCLALFPCSCFLFHCLVYFFLAYFVLFHFCFYFFLFPLNCLFRLVSVLYCFCFVLFLPILNP